MAASVAVTLLLAVQHVLVRLVWRELANVRPLRNIRAVVNLVEQYRRPSAESQFDQRGCEGGDRSIPIHLRL